MKLERPLEKPLLAMLTTGNSSLSPPQSYIPDRHRAYGVLPLELSLEVKLADFLNSVTTREGGKDPF